MLLFGLIIAGLTLLSLLMICIIVTCVKKKRVNQTTIRPATMNIIQRRISSGGHHSNSSNTDRKAMIQDTSSEASEEQEPAPYFRKVRRLILNLKIYIKFELFSRNQMTNRQEKSRLKQFQPRRKRLPSFIIHLDRSARQQQSINVIDH